MLFSTHLSLLQALRVALPTLLASLTLRSIPFAGFALSGSGLPRSVRAVALGIVALLCSGVWASPPGGGLPPGALALGFGWLVLFATLLHRLAPLLRRRAVRSFGTLALALSGFMLVPVAVRASLPRLFPPIALGFFLTFGWEASLRAHSYCAAVAEKGLAPSLRNALFSLIVHPNVVYEGATARIVPAKVSPRALFRMTLGAAAMSGRDLVLAITMTAPWPGWSEVGRVHSPLGYLEFMATQLLFAAGLYAAHSGLASFHIGWMRLFGHELRERYHLPMMATSPQDFWNRWNTWVGEWAKRYIFVPCSLAAVRRLGGAMGASLGALTAFAGIGLLHDVGIWCLRATAADASFSFRMTLVFLLFGVILVGWRTAARALKAGSRSLPSWLQSGLAWAVAIQFIGWLAWLAVPVLKNGTFPSVIEHLVRR